MGKKEIPVTTVQTKIRVMNAQIKQPLEKDKKEILAAQRYLLIYAQKGNKDEVKNNAKKIIKAKRNVACYERLLECTEYIKDNCQTFTRSAAQNPKVIPQEYFPYFNDICVAAHYLGGKVASIGDFVKTILAVSYDKPNLQKLQSTDDVSNQIKSALITEAISDLELNQLYQELFVQMRPEDQQIFERTVGPEVRPPSAAQSIPQYGNSDIPQAPPTIPTAPPTIPTAPPTIPTAPPTIPTGPPTFQGYPSFDQPPQAPGQPFDVNSNLVLLADIPPFDRTRWPQLSKTVYDATV